MGKNPMGYPADESGSSDSDRDETEGLLRIAEKKKLFNSRKQLEKFLKRTLGKVSSFDRIDCSGNSYDLTSCEYIAELVTEKSRENLWQVNFSNMFVTRSKDILP